MSVTHHVSRVTLCIVVASLLLFGCAPQSAEPQPPEIAYGQDVCEVCGMILSDARFAAAIVTSEGQAHKFDDIDDMLAYQREHPGEQVQAWFVHDYYSESWMRGEAAFYVTSPQIDSPMGHGIAAFETHAAAQAFARDRGVEVRTFEDMRSAGHAALP